jgi:hypothetical protein
MTHYLYTQIKNDNKKRGAEAPLFHQINSDAVTRA